MKKSININCDLGEGGKLDSEIMPLISSCNIACGGHFGDDKSIYQAMKLAKQNSVLIGAHPSYPDQQNFGRKTIVMTNEDLEESLLSQLNRFFIIAKAMQLPVYHIKPHGALYHDIAYKPNIAKLFINVLNHFSNKLIIYTSPDALLCELLPTKQRIYKEVFADRSYKDNKRLVNRTEENAVLCKPEQVKNQVLDLVLHNKVKTIEGNWINFKFNTICFHSDNPNALNNLRLVKQVLLKNQIYTLRANA